MVGGRLSGRLGAVLALALFLATAVPAAAADPLFQPYEAYPVGSWPEAVAIGDVTGDGRNDVVMTTSFYFDEPNDYRLWVFAQAADGTLSAPVSYPTAAAYGNRPESVAIGDLTGDGRADVVLGLSGLGMQVFPQTTVGALAAPSFTSTTNSLVLRLGHLNGDSRLDVAGLGWGTDTVSVFLNDGTGGLLAPSTHAAQHDGYDDLEVGDVSGDARDDLVVMSGQGSAPNVSVLPQLAAGGFGPAAEYRVPDGTWDLTHGIGVGDVTGDGLDDVVASYGGNKPNSWVAVFAQNTGGALEAPVSYESYDIPEPVDVADVDLDGRADVVTLHGGWNEAGVYRQQADGTLAVEELSAIPYASHYNPHGLALGDVNGDGSPDAVLADYNHGLVVLRNTRAGTPPPPPPPPSADVGVELTASAARVKPRKSFSLTAAVTNGGPDASNVSLAVQLAGPASSLAVSGQGCSLSGTTVTCSFAAMAPGSTTSVGIYGTAGERGTLTASGTVDGSADDPNAANDTDAAAIQVR
jgi:FG-GAP-like repeat/Domain of unknown function DUF11